MEPLRSTGNLPKTNCPRCGDDLAIDTDAVLDFSLCRCGLFLTVDELIDGNSDYQWVE